MSSFRPKRRTIRVYITRRPSGQWIITNITAGNHIGDISGNMPRIWREKCVDSPDYESSGRYVATVRDNPNQFGEQFELNLRRDWYTIDREWQYKSASGLARSLKRRGLL